MDAEQQVWTEEIKSQNNLWSINFKELWHYRDLLVMFVKKDLLLLQANYFRPVVVFNSADSNDVDFCGIVWSSSQIIN